MEKLKFLNKKAAIGSTLGWLVATFIIVLILIAYFTFLSFFYLGGKSETSKIELSGDTLKLDATRALIGFLESDAGNGEKIYDLAVDSEVKDGKEDARETLFESKAEEFLKNYYPADSSIMTLVKTDGSIIYSIFYDIQAGSEAPEAIPQPFIGSVSVDIPVPGNKILNLLVHFR